VVDPVTAELGAEGIREASGLVTRWLDSVQNRNNQIADRIVYEATLALANMRTYCNQARLVHVPLQGFSLDWPPERRAHLRDAWIRWRSIYDIFQALETVTDTLHLREIALPTRWWHRGEQDQQAVEPLQTELAWTLARFLNDVVYQIKHAKISIEPNDFDVDAQSIKDVSTLVLDLVEDPGETLVAQARTTVVRLRETVLGRRADLPREVWRQLDALAFGG
jgi:hypothetical protein